MSTNKSQESGRIDYVDLAKGFCITLVVAIHIVDFFAVSFPAASFFCAFRMPLYFFLSGLFFKRYENFRGFALRKTNKLLIPFFFFYLLTSVLLTNALHWFGYDVRNVDIIGIQSLWAFITPGLFSNGPIWFLLCLFWVNILFYCIILISDHISGHLQIASIVFLSILCGTCGWLASKLSIDLWAFFDTALSAVPFFCFGYILRKYTPILTANKSDRFLPILIIVAGIATWIFRGGMYFQQNDYGTNNPLVVFAGGCFGTLMIMFIAKRFTRIPFLSYWGRYSIIILCTHIMLVQLLFRIISHLGLIETIGVWPSYIVILLITMFSFQLIIPLCIKFIPWFTAQKDLIPIPSKSTTTQQPTQTN